MIRILIIIMLIHTFSYWIGYLIGLSENNKRPICFISFGEKNDSDVEYYWGYWRQEERPISSNSDLEFLSFSLKGNDVYFLIEKNALFKEANGRRITATFNIGEYTKKENPSYIRYLYRKGVRFKLESDNSDDSK